MQNIRIDGKGTLTAGEYGTVTIDGFGRGEGEIKAESLRIDGRFSCRDHIEAGKLLCDGFATFQGDINSKDVNINGKFTCVGKFTTEFFDCDGMATFNTSVYAKKIVVDGLLSMKNNAPIESGEIHCNGCIRSDGQISADLIDADGIVRADELVGDKIVIMSKTNSIAQLFIKTTSSARFIEATTIDLRGMTADTVNGHDIKIGPQCEIKHLDCTGTLRIHRNAVVEEITGNYVTAEY